MQYHYLYKIICLVSNCFYIGRHSTNNLNDGYMGSGTKLAKSKNLFGEEYHIKKILKFCNSKEELIILEQLVVNEKLLLHPRCLNLILGGTGGFEEIIKQRLNIYENHSEIAKQNLKIANEVLIEKRKNPEWQKWMNNQSGIGVKAKWAKDGHPWIGKNHNENTKNKIGEANSISQAGEKNSQYGTMWINNGIEAKKIKKDEFIPEGWQKGRKLVK